MANLTHLTEINLHLIRTCIFGFPHISSDLHANLIKCTISQGVLMLIKYQLPLFQRVLPVLKSSGKYSSWEKYKFRVSSKAVIRGQHLRYMIFVFKLWLWNGYLLDQIHTCHIHTLKYNGVSFEACVGMINRTAISLRVITGARPKSTRSFAPVLSLPYLLSVTGSVLF